MRNNIDDVIDLLPDVVIMPKTEKYMVAVNSETGELEFFCPIGSKKR